MSDRKATLLLFSLMLLSATFAAAQGRQASVDAFNKWTSRISAKPGTSNTSFQAVAVSVDPRSASGLTVNLAIGTSQDIKTLPALSITVQPVNVDKSGSVEELGQCAKMASPVFERTMDDQDAILFTPRITVSDDARANAVRVTVRGLDGSSVLTMLVPVGSETTTSVLGKIGSDPNTL